MTERTFKQGDNWSKLVQTSSEQRAAIASLHQSTAVVLAVIAAVGLPLYAAFSSERFRRQIKNLVPKARGPEAPGQPSE
ncbi:hypothetical protein HY024_04235 [Candidatus Curtissbacteria bacterium]|nr:hypothetical protein [Candidatus Curtissbacteria bacterium]